MKKLILPLILLMGLISLATTASAQNMMGQPYYNNAIYQTSNSSSATAQDEAAGKAIWDKLQSKQAECKTLTDADYDLLGDYFMGLMVGNSHSVMNNRMTQTMGDQGEKQMHIVMGKRFSGCDNSATLPSQYQGFSYLMPMMGGLNFQNSQWGPNMMSQYGFSGLPLVHWITMLLVWAVLVLSIIALINYIKHSKRK